jgi:hypothetical protein
MNFVCVCVCVCVCVRVRVCGGWVGGWDYTVSNVGNFESDPVCSRNLYVSIKLFSFKYVADECL